MIIVRGASAVVLFFGFILLVCSELKLDGVHAMAQSTAKLGWEWRAKRALAQRVGIKIDRIKRESGGLFGILKSPSLGGSLPDPMEVDASIVAVDRPGLVDPVGTIRFRIPMMELNDAEAGTLAALGVIGETVVCFAPAPTGMTEDRLAEWLPDAPCAD